MKIGILYESSDDLEEYPGQNLEDTAVRKKSASAPSSIARQSSTP
jgi:hypothetical protein